MNRQWRGYRSKAPARAASEIDRLSDRHQVLSVALVDNLIPAQGADRLFNALSRSQKDFKLFCEIRATTSKRTLTAMAAAGVDEVQIGIESLCTRLLKKLGKGTTAIANLEIMKHCEELGITHRSNIILNFPGSDLLDVSETLRTLRFAAPFRPMRTVQFWLGLGSPVWNAPSAYGIRAVFNHPSYRRLFPDDLVDAIDFMIQGYRGDLTVQRKLWLPVKRAVQSWKKEYASLHATPRSGPILGYRDGGRFMIIRQRRPGGDPVTHRLEGTSREIYRFCGHRRTLGRILAHFPQLGQERLLPFLRMMTAKRLMYEDHGSYLSLAVRMR